MSTAVKLVIAACIVTGVTAYMAYVGTTTSWQYYLTVDEGISKFFAIMNGKLVDNVSTERINYFVGVKPVYDLEGDFAGRVAVIPDRAELLFDKIANDEPLIIEEANVGTGAVVAEDQGDSGQVDSESTDAEPKTQPEGAQSSEGASVSSESEPLPSWVQGTNASVKSCSS